MLDEFVQQGDESLPARGVWIEIEVLPIGRITGRVTPRKGSVD